MEASKPDDWDEDQPEFVFDTTPPRGWLADEPKMVLTPTAQFTYVFRSLSILILFDPFFPDSRQDCD